MRTHNSYDYAVVRVVPRVERGEFINVGIILWCPSQSFLGARIELDEQRLQGLDADVNVEAVRSHLASIPLVCAGGPEAGPIGLLSPRARFDWLVAPRSTIIQVSPVHTGRCTEVSSTLEHLLNVMVRT